MASKLGFYQKLEYLKRNSFQKEEFGNFRTKAPRKLLLRHSLRLMKKVSKSLKIESDKF